MNELMATLWKKGIRKIEISYSGGEDDGGIDDLNVFPETFALLDGEADDVKSIGNELFDEWSIGFTGDGHYSGAYGTITIDILNEHGKNCVTCDNTSEYHTECTCSAKELKDADGSCDTDHGMDEEQETFNTELE